MIDISILRAMAAAGAPVEVILAAIEVDQRSEIARVQARRLADAERQRLSRMSHGQAVTPRDTADTNEALTSFLPSSKPIETNKKEEKKKVRGGRVGKHLLPDDWTPKPVHYAKAEREFVEQKADDLRNWAKSKGIMRIDWDATFHGFLKPRANGGLLNVQTDRDRGKSDFKQALRELKEYAASPARSDDGGEVVRFLPAAGRGE